MRFPALTVVSALAAACLAAGCGTTVPLAGQALGQGTGTGPAAGAVAGPGTAGPVVAPGLPPTSAAVAGAAGTGPGAAAGPAGGGASGPGVAAGTGGPGPGGAVPVARGPLLVGLAYDDNATSNAAFGYTGSSVTAKSAAEALVKGMNSEGGVHGRRLQTAEYSFNTDDQNFGSDATAACTQFTQDDHVPLVLDLAFGAIGGFEQCLQHSGVYDIGINDEGDQVISRSDPLHANTMTMSSDRMYGAVVSRLAEAGYLAPANQLGVVLEQCPEYQRTYDHTLLPLVSRLRLKAPKLAAVSCTAGFQSAAPDASAISNAELQFRAAGVDRVMIVSTYEALLLTFFTQDANSQQYLPGYALSSNAQVGLVRSGIPSGQWPQLRGVGNVPGYDEEGGEAPTAVENRCTRLAREGGLQPAGYNDDEQLWVVCGAFLLLDSALATTGGSAAAPALAAAVAALGAGFVAPGVVAGRTLFSSSRHDGPDRVRLFGFAAACTCMRYSGSALPAPQ